MAIAEHGTPDGWDFHTAYEYTLKYFIPYVKTGKMCGTFTSSDVLNATGCFINNGGNGTWYYLNGGEVSDGGGYGSPYYYTMILKNGMHVAIWAPAKVNQLFQKNVIFLVDVNGHQGSTTIGKDVFLFTFELNTGKFKTGGKPANYNQNDCALTDAGRSCAYWIEKNHWEFPDDYPVKDF